MITLNSTILSYNKIKEIEEYKPMLPPDSIYLLDEKNNHSFQKFIPHIYDLDEIDFHNKLVQSNSSPIIKTHNGLKNNFLNSIIIINQGNEKNKNKEIYNNIYKNPSVNSKNTKKIIYTEEDHLEKEEFRNNNIFKNEINKIDNNIKNNIENKNGNVYKKKFKEKINLVRNNTSKNIKKKEINESINEISNSNFNNDLLNSNLTINNYKKANEIKSIDIYEKKSIKSAVIPFNLRNIMRKDPSKDNAIIINTSLYKKNKHNNINNISKENEINRSSLNSYFRLEEDKKENKITLDKNNKKEEILKSFISSNSTNVNKLEKINTYTSNNTNLNINENNIDNDDKNSIKFNNLNNYNFGASPSIINNNITNNKPKLSHPVLNSENNINNTNNIKNGNNSSYNRSKSIKPKPKYNFDYPISFGNIITNNIIKENNNKNFEEKKDEEKKEVKKEVKKENKSPIVYLKLNNLKKILQKDGLFNVLTFLDCYDLMCLLKTNKSLIFLINKAISNAYYFKIKHYLYKFNSYIELLKCSLIYTKVKDSIKIDFETKIRFKNHKNYNNINTYNDKEMTPKCFQFIYFYNYFKSINSQIKLKTKENSKKVKMYDYYTFDLYSEYDKNFPDIYINKEQPLFDVNNYDILVYIQPILPFKINDKGILDLEIYSSNYDFINPSSIKIAAKCYDLKKYINNLSQKGYNNLRICEYENICFHWKIMSNERRYSDKTFFNIINKVEKKFKPYFDIQNILYENISFFIFKIYLVAVKTGKIGNKQSEDDFGFNITIKNKGEYVENEIKKNNLLLDRREAYELRLGETIIFYFSEKPEKAKIVSNNKK